AHIASLVVCLITDGCQALSNLFFLWFNIRYCPIIPGNTGQLNKFDYTDVFVDIVNTAQNQTFKALQNFSMPILITSICQPSELFNALNRNAWQCPDLI
ncbi:MAG: hypothetical protein R6V15_02315, partial [Desulfotignum sp.]